MEHVVRLCLVTASPGLIDDVAFVVERLDALLAGTTECAVLPSDFDGMQKQLQRKDSPQATLALLTAQAANYLAGRAGAKLSLRFDCFSSLTQAHVALRQADVPPEMVVVDVSAEDPEAWDDPCAELLELASLSGRRARITPHSAVLVLPKDADLAAARVRYGNQHLRLAGAAGPARQADLLQIVMDHLDHAHLNRMLARWGTSAEGSVGLAERVCGFMRSHWSERWDFHSYTGSMVAGFIRSMHQLNAEGGVRCLSGRSEHSLAAGALAGWQLFGRAYVIAVTSGMIDEFRGTLANLRRASAPGLIICADSLPSTWYAFQGTMDGENDGPRVIEARGLDHVFIRTADEVVPKLNEAFEKLLRRPAPVFVFATQGALEAVLPEQPRDWPRARPAAASDAPGVQESLAQLLHIINEEPAQMLWQCGRLSDEEHRLVLEISERAGIALADSLTHPGTVADYSDGRPVPQYLGALSMYGFSRRLYRFLHTEHRLNGPQEQCLLFLKGRVDQAATPFSEAKLKRQVRIAQVNRRAEHIAPFTDIGLVMDALPFLQQVRDGLEVKPEVLAMRRAKLAALAELSEITASDHIATEPMSVNHFLCRLGLLVREQIERRGYRYTGVYDVGRGGASALRNVPRTGPGFSGWYGRALMGDANVALPYIAATATGDVLAFVGDGARALVPDIEEDLIAALAARPDARERNVTVFYLCNGVLSLIQTYLDKRYAHNGREQVTVPLPPLHAVAEQRGAIEVRRHRISRFDTALLDAALSARGRLNVIEVVLSHNSEGDGLSLASETSWNRQ